MSSQNRLPSFPNENLETALHVIVRFPGENAGNDNERAPSVTNFFVQKPTIIRHSVFFKKLCDLLMFDFRPSIPITGDPTAYAVFFSFCENEDINQATGINLGREDGRLQGYFLDMAKCYVLGERLRAFSFCNAVINILVSLSKQCNRLGIIGGCVPKTIEYIISHEPGKVRPEAPANYTGKVLRDGCPGNSRVCVKHRGGHNFVKDENHEDCWFPEYKAWVVERQFANNPNQYEDFLIIDSKSGPQDSIIKTSQLLRLVLDNYDASTILGTLTEETAVQELSPELEEFYARLGARGHDSGSGLDLDIKNLEVPWTRGYCAYHIHIHPDQPKDYSCHFPLAGRDRITEVGGQVDEEATPQRKKRKTAASRNR
ncbi:hypothetical protein B0O99DRAFT_692235 [Bisporella sp. PMI_857]|nr:hypothetical protein B0O99DRAFT_692235 [Bisporella sp. PMI_857]